MKKGKQVPSYKLGSRLAKKNVSSFNGLKNILFFCSFEQITEETLTRNAIRFGHRPPNSARIKQTEKQISFQRWFEDYCIVIHTSFNPLLGKNGEFTTKGGSGWVLVTQNVNDRVYVRQFYRRFVDIDKFIENILNETELLINRLEHRPIVKGTSSLYKIKQTDVETVWVHPTDETNTKYFFLELDGYLKKHFDKKDYFTKNYQNVVRPKKKIVNRARDKRKTWDKGNKEVTAVVLS